MVREWCAAHPAPSRLRKDARMGPRLKSQRELLLSECSLCPPGTRTRACQGFTLPQHVPFLLTKEHCLCSCHLLRLQGAARLPGSGQQAVILGSTKAVFKLSQQQQLNNLNAWQFCPCCPATDNRRSSASGKEGAGMTNSGVLRLLPPVRREQQ